MINMGAGILSAVVEVKDKKLQVINPNVFYRGAKLSIYTPGKLSRRGDITVKSINIKRRLLTSSNIPAGTRAGDLIGL